MKIIIASHNENKVKEFKNLFKNISFISLKELNDYEDIEETSTTFKGNAYLKAKAIYDKYKIPVIADDSGISAIALNNEPGVFSKRYSSGDDEANNQLLIKNLINKDNTVFYTCAICFILNENTVYEVEDYCYGKFINERRGTNGFGYDPYFFVPELNKTIAEISLEEKNKISHRAKALLKLESIIKNLC